MKTIFPFNSGFTVGFLRSHKRFCRAVASVSSFAMLTAASAPAFAGTAVLGGDATLTAATGANLAQNTDAYAQFVSSGGASAVLDWSKFDIGAGKEMNFSGAGTTFFNLVDAAASKSQINGIISGNGSVWVVNPNGIAFGANSQVNIGGIFAAAAGNISNADALRSGTATMPEFSSFEGVVSTAAGSAFTAGQVALLGKTVSASGDFTGASDLSIGAAGKLAVDEVAGGKITINLPAFVEKTKEELNLGTLLVDGEMRAVTDGNMSVNGDVNAGSVYFKSGGEMNIKSDVTANSGNLQLLTQDGDIAIDNGVNLITHGDAATLQVQAGQNDVSLDENYNLIYSTGNVAIDGNLQADGENGTISVIGGYNGLGGVQITGSLKSSGDVRIFTENGDVSVAKGAEIKSLGDGAKVLIYTGLSEYNLGGDIDVAGDVEATGKNALIDIESGWNYYTDGGLSVSGSIKANGENGSITLAQGNGYGSNPGRLSLSGKVEAAGDVSAISYDSTVKIAPGAEVTALGNVSLRGVGVEGVDVPPEGTSAMIKSGGQVLLQNVTVGSKCININATGDVRGLATLNAQNSHLSIYTETGNISFGGTAKVLAGRISFVAPKGSILANNTLNKIGGIDEISVAENGSASVKAQNIINLSGNYSSEIVAALQSGIILIDGDLTAPDLILLVAQQGDVYVMKGCTVSATGDGALVSLSASSDVTVCGKIKADAVELSAIGNMCIAKGSEVNGAVEVVSVTANGDLLVNGTLHGNTVELQSKKTLVIDASAQITAIGYTPIELENGTSYNKGIDIMSSNGDVLIAQGARVDVKDANGDAVISGENVSIDGSLSAGRDVTVSADGDVNIAGVVSAGNVAMTVAKKGSIQVDGSVEAGKEVLVESLTADAIVNGVVHSDSTAMVSAESGGVSINGLVEGGDAAAVFSGQDGIDIDGRVIADGKDGFAFLSSGGNVQFSQRGEVRGTEGAAVYAKGNLTQADGNLPYGEGRIEARSLRPAVTGKEVTLHTAGSIGGGASRLFVVDGKVYAVSFGDMYLAAGRGHSLEGGNASSVAAARNTAQFTIDSARKALDGSLSIEAMMDRIANPSDFDDNAIMYASGDMYLYTAGKLDANSYIGSDGNMTVSATSFGDLSYLQAGGTLTINNVGKPGSPKIAYFESVNGVEPKINNQPNDTVIFVDGRLAGGNLKILNQFGADEAFMVSTPELKSTQGIFGSPTFLHSDLDVANPMEVGSIDYMLQETPRLTLDKDFPKEADQHVDSVVIPERDSFQFGRGGKTAEEKPSTDVKISMAK